MPTLPSLRTRESKLDQPAKWLRLTVVFHPDVGRVGASFVVATLQYDRFLLASRRLVIGRDTPFWSDGRPLEEPHVSGQALLWEVCKKGIRVSAGAGADVRIGREQSTEALFAVTDLEEGVPVRLGHGVVLFLHLSSASEWRAAWPDCATRGVVGVSESMQRVRALARAAGGLMLPALIVGETGVGKEVVAKSIHDASPRRHKPWVPVNMAAIPESLAAAELFGAAAGAYTGARFAREGAFQRADGSTLFLDEIGDTPPLLQTQLLRALQQGEVQIVGGKPTQVDIRVISATDVPIHASTGFRRALLERLSGITIPIAPLRERREDIGVLVLHHLVNSLPEVYADLSHRWLTNAHLAAHWAHALFHWSLADWPGNVRELGMAVSRLASADEALVAPQERALHDNRAKGLYDYDEDELLKIHEVHGYEMAATARALGVSRQRLYRRIADFDGWRTIDKIDDQELLEAIDKHGRDVRVLHQVLRVPIRNLKRRLSVIAHAEG